MGLCVTNDGLCIANTGIFDICGDKIIGYDALNAINAGKIHTGVGCFLFRRDVRARLAGGGFRLGKAVENHVRRAGIVA